MTIDTLVSSIAAYRSKKVPFRVIQSHLEPFGQIWTNFDHLESFGQIWTNFDHDFDHDCPKSPRRCPESPRCPKSPQHVPELICLVPFHSENVPKKFGVNPTNQTRDMSKNLVFGPVFARFWPNSGNISRTRIFPEMRFSLKIVQHQNASF